MVIMMNSILNIIIIIIILWFLNFCKLKSFTNKQI